ncbi:MAG: cupin domain-containing protein [Actinomycetia bacterium]|nr:cupin domain-containing protein [Actinomycetes bacterium]
MDAIIHHLAPATVLRLADQVEVRPGQVVSKTLVQNDAVGLTLFAFDAGEQLSAHTSPGDALVTVLDGIARITLDGEPHELHRGESILMPANVAHAVFAVEPFRMALLQVFPAPEQR